MKTLAIAASMGLVALAGSPAWAQYGYAPPAPPPAPIEEAYPSTAPYVIDPVDADNTYDEDGYDVDEDVYYDTVAAENYDDGYDPQAYQQFQSALDPYGQWVNDPTYGEVWSPSPNVVGYDFQPYATGGHWVLTEYGWTWVSDWDWGWGPFHYGRWLNGGHGWCWVPGSIWGPGWVSWRSGGGYAGWSPLPPRGVTVGPPRGVRSPWRFVLAHQLGQPRMSFLPSHVVPAVFAKTAVVTNLRTANAVRFNAGPNPGSIRTPYRPLPLGQVGPRALPHAGVIAHPGMPLQTRPWYRGPARPPSIPLHSGVPYPRSITLGHPAPMVRRPTGPAVTPARPFYNGSLTVVRPQYQAPPVYQPPSAPRYNAPAYNQPAYRAPSYQAPAYRAPSYQAPAYRAPSYQAPAYRAPSYQAPAYRAPSYQAPAYRAPSYQAPSYHSAPAPSYHSAPAGGGHFSGGGGRHR